MSRAAELCQLLDGILKEEELTPERRADVEGVKKAMELLAFKVVSGPRICPTCMPVQVGGINGA